MAVDQSMFIVQAKLGSEVVDLQHPVYHIVYPYGSIREARSREYQMAE